MDKIGVGVKDRRPVSSSPLAAEMALTIKSGNDARSIFLRVLHSIEEALNSMLTFVGKKQLFNAVFMSKII